jgi:Peptidase family M28
MRVAAASFSLRTAPGEFMISPRKLGFIRLAATATMLLLVNVARLAAQGQTGPGNDPAEPAQGQPTPKPTLPPAGAIARTAVDENSMRQLIEQLVACGTRLTLSSRSDPNRGIGCARDHIVARLHQIAAHSGGKLQVVVDTFEATSPRTYSKPATLENVYGVLAGSDPALAKTVFIVSGHYDSMSSNVMDAETAAPGADDDASGTTVSMETARLLTKANSNRATLLFAALAGEEQGLLGGTRVLEWAKRQGYIIGGMLDDDIVGADFAFGAPHRVRLFSGNGDVDDCDSPSRELARAIEEIAGRASVRLIFRVDRYGRGGDHYPFYKAGLPAVRFTEPLENYAHEHQTPRTENGMEYGDQIKYLNFLFMGNVVRANAEALRQLSMAPAPPQHVVLRGAVTPDAKIAWAAEDDAQRAGFEILWRETTESRWQVFDCVSTAREVVLPGVSTDNHFFAVRAVGKNGARSIAVPSQAAEK